MPTPQAATPHSRRPQLVSAHIMTVHRGSPRVDPAREACTVVRRRSCDASNYAIEVQPTTGRGIIVTGRGYFVVIDLDRVPATNQRWPTF